MRTLLEEIECYWTNRAAINQNEWTNVWSDIVKLNTASTPMFLKRG